MRRRPATVPPGRIRCNVRVALRRDDDGTEYNRVRGFDVLRVDEPEVDAFAPPAETPSTVPENAPAEFQPHLERLTDLALESLSARKSRELGRVFSQLLEYAQAEGLAVVIYERQQTVYPVTERRRDGA